MRQIEAKNSGEAKSSPLSALRSLQNAARRSRAAFSLIELLTVMAIMGLLTTVAVTSYFSAVRGMARRSALQHLASTLTLARQRACMEGKQMSVFVFGEVVSYNGEDGEGEGSGAEIVPTYTVCRKLGRISCIDSVAGNDLLIDEFGGLDKIFPPVFDSASADSSVKLSDFVREHKFETLRLYNLSRGKWSDVYTRVAYAPLDDRYSGTRNAANSSQTEDYRYEIPSYGFIIKNRLNANWELGDAYGFEVEPANTLPTGFAFDDIDDENDCLLVSFAPDGTATGDLNFKIVEKASKASAEVKVDRDGRISWDQSNSAWK